MNNIENLTKKHADKTSTCKECQESFTYTPFTWYDGSTINQDTCESCDEILIAKHKAAMEAKATAETMANRREFWEEICPERFTLTDTTHPEFSLPLHKRVMEWSPSPLKPWLGMVGRKGCCKTRIALLRLQQAVMTKEGPFSRNSTKPVFLTAYEFVDAVQSKFGSNHDKSASLLGSYMTARWLVFDDISKARATPAVVSALFALIDHRHACNLTTIWTSNSTPEEFCEGMPADVAGPLARRLKESSTLYSIS